MELNGFMCIGLKDFSLINPARSSTHQHFFIFYNFNNLVLSSVVENEWLSNREKYRKNDSIKVLLFGCNIEK